MDQYTIYCTEEQTKKAARLGAQLEIGEGKGTVMCRYRNYHTFERMVIPTAEQLIGWLEEQGIQITTYVTAFDEWKAVIYTNKDPEAIAETNWLNSRKEATLAAIDAALEYLYGNNQARPLV